MDVLKGGWITAAAWALQATAYAQGGGTPAPPVEAVIPHPDWLRKPTGNDMATNYPAIAASKGKQGRAVMKCKITGGGYLEGCQILGEAPRNLGFGPSTLRLSKYFKATNGAAGGVVTIPVAWKIYPGPPTPVVAVDRAPWVSIPTREDVIAAFPPAAIGKSVRGLVVMKCGIDILGSAVACQAVSAEPAGLGFEEAAIKLAAKFTADTDWRTSPSTDIDVQVKIPVQFATADDPIWKTSELGKIAWLKTADPDEVRALFPVEALKAGLSSGSAMVDCVVGEHGALTGCTPYSEIPQNLGFGNAAAQIALKFVVNPWTTTGLSTEGAHLKLPIKMEYSDKDRVSTPATKR